MTKWNYLSVSQWNNHVEYPWRYKNIFFGEKVFPLRGVIVRRHISDISAWMAYIPPLIEETGRHEGTVLLGEIVII